jgi:hypothetical protein
MPFGFIPDSAFGFAGIPIVRASGMIRSKVRRSLSSWLWSGVNPEVVSHPRKSLPWVIWDRVAQRAGDLLHRLDA